MLTGEGPYGRNAGWGGHVEEDEAHCLTTSPAPVLWARCELSTEDTPLSSLTALALASWMSPPPVLSPTTPYLLSISHNVWGPRQGPNVPPRGIPTIIASEWQVPPLYWYIESDDSEHDSVSLVRLALSCFQPNPNVTCKQCPHRPIPVLVSTWRLLQLREGVHPGHGEAGPSRGLWKPDVVVDTWNPSYFRGVNERIMVWGWPWEKAQDTT
jgi:hypothetical protein